MASLPRICAPETFARRHGTGPTCDFVFTGYRIPLVVISPFTKKNYVSHTVADSTSILKLIETRFNIPALTKRDAAQYDMTEFFDFVNVPWATPPTPPDQNMGGTCSLNPATAIEDGGTSASPVRANAPGLGKRGSNEALNRRPRHSPPGAR